MDINTYAICTIGFVLSACVSSPDNRASDATETWTSNKSMDQVAGCINESIRSDLINYGGISSTLQTIIPDKEYRITQAESKNGSKSFTVTLIQLDNKVRIEYRGKFAWVGRYTEEINSCV
jgi:hypothetical protein